MIPPKAIMTNGEGQESPLKILKSVRQLAQVNQQFLHSTDKMTTLQGQNIMQQSIDQQWAGNFERRHLIPNIIMNQQNTKHTRLQMKSRSPPQTESLLPNIKSNQNTIVHDQNQQFGAKSSSINRMQTQIYQVQQIAPIGNMRIQNGIALGGAALRQSGQQIIMSPKNMGAGFKFNLDNKGAMFGRSESRDYNPNTLYQLMTENHSNSTIIQNDSLLLQKGRVMATKGGRTGILAKTKELAVYQPYAVQEQTKQMNMYGHESQTGSTGEFTITDRSTMDQQNKSDSQQMFTSPTRMLVSNSRNSHGNIPNVQGAVINSHDVLRHPLRQNRHLREEFMSCGSHSVDSCENINYNDVLNRGFNVPMASTDLMNVKDDDQCDITDDEAAAGKINSSSTDKQAPRTRQVHKKGQQPFDFKFIKVLIKKNQSDKELKEVMIDREWVQKNNNVPHFVGVVKNVAKDEGVEITMNCNYDAFQWIMDFTRCKTDGDDEIEAIKKSSKYWSQKKVEEVKDEVECKLYSKMDYINNTNCLNVLVTAYFLQLHWVYEKIWDYYFSRNFSEVINECKISLTNINPLIVKDISMRISEVQLDRVQERKDKFLGNVYKLRCDQLIIHKARQNNQNQLQTNFEKDMVHLYENNIEEKDDYNLYWCSQCQMMFTKAQCKKISCKGIAKTREKYFDRHNSQIEDDGFVQINGERFLEHDIKFAEEVPYYGADMIIDKDSKMEVAPNKPIDIENFVKFFREKYRLCWKEIYLKFKAILALPERCKNCRQWFQLSSIANCMIDQPENSVLTEVESMTFCKFHEIDTDDKLEVGQNEFSKNEIDIFKRQVQVIDNIYIPDPISNKAFDQISLLMSKFKEEIEFVEPQSMNYSVKINHVYPEFLDYIKERKEEGKGTKMKEVDAHVKGLQASDLFDKNSGELKQTQSQQIDDILMHAPRARMRIESKLKNQSFMNKLHRQCEQYVKDNPEAFFERKESKRFKYDFDNGTITETGVSKSKRNKSSNRCDPVEAAHAQALVIKRFRKVRSDILYEDDEATCNYLMKIIQQIRTDNEGEQSSKKKIYQLVKQVNVNNSGVRRKMSPILGRPLIPRYRSPNQAKREDKDKQSQSQISQLEPWTVCDLSSQTNVKIYTDLKQITVKPKTVGPKQPVNIAKDGGAARKNFILRNMARSQGARSGSNQGNPKFQASTPPNINVDLPRGPMNPGESPSKIKINRQINGQAKSASRAQDQIHSQFQSRYGNESICAGGDQNGDALKSVHQSQILTSVPGAPPVERPNKNRIQRSPQLNNHKMQLIGSGLHNSQIQGHQMQLGLPPQPTSHPNLSQSVLQPPGSSGSTGTHPTQVIRNNRSPVLRVKPNQAMKNNLVQQLKNQQQN